ncbi:hypothetical protein DPMN_031046 [Dreissena polymorpha]|uniref:MULE transposase domain-containing protein n=1 Tax=Dreissena polymorpha TaxID=45954 RepID=A0A9D4M212_DREPO|nr:hypothetical protein DPMN_031046 [Dreissena polymorpha]
MFKEAPVLPIAFMIRERKFQSCHESFVDILKQQIPNLDSKHVMIVTDQEQAIEGAFETTLENAKVVNCWVHILNDVKFWVLKHSGTMEDRIGV